MIFKKKRRSLFISEFVGACIIAVDYTVKQMRSPVQFRCSLSNALLAHRKLENTGAIRCLYLLFYALRRIICHVDIVELLNRASLLSRIFAIHVMTRPAVQRKASHCGQSRRPGRRCGHVATPGARPRPKPRPNDHGVRMRSSAETCIRLRNLSGFAYMLPIASRERQRCDDSARPRIHRTFRFSRTHQRFR